MVGRMKRFRLQFIFYSCLVLLVVACIQPAPANSQQITVGTVLANHRGDNDLDSTAQHRAFWIPYFQYSNYRSGINWPMRAGDCPLPTGSNTSYKTLPWLGQTSGFGGQIPQAPDPSGNTFSQAGNCANRYVDGGESSHGGAWLRANALGGWATSKSSSYASTWHQPTFTAGTKLDSVIFGDHCWHGNGCLNPVWGTDHIYGEGCWSPGGEYDITWCPGEENPREQTVNMFRANGYGSYTPDIHNGKQVFINSNGTSLFRNLFTISPDEWSRFQGVTIRLCIAADDWYKVWINGLPAATRTHVSGSYDCYNTGITDLVNQGTNVLAIQVNDKARWSNYPAEPIMGSGVAYELAVLLPPDDDDDDDDGSANSCPSFSPLQRTVNLPARGKPATEYGNPRNISTSAEQPDNSWSTGGWSYVGRTAGGRYKYTRYRYKYPYKKRTALRDVDRYEYVYRNGNLYTEVDKVEDSQWAGEMTDFNDSTDGDGTVELDYSDHARDYPYDNHQPRVEYRVRYERFDDVQTGTARIERRIAEYQNGYSDVSGSSNINDLGAWVSYSAGNRSYPSTWPAYSWSTTTTDSTGSSPAWTSAQYENAPVMPYCFPRSVEVTQITLSDPRFDDLEDPTTLTYPANMSVRFFQDYTSPKRMRQQFRVTGLQVTGNFNVQRFPSGTVTTPRTGGNMPGGQTITRTVGNSVVPASGLYQSHALSAVHSAGIPNLRPGDRGGFTVSSRREVNVDPNGNILSSHAAGIRAPTGTRSFGPRTGPRLHNRPYLKVYGGSVAAGSRFTIDGSVMSSGGGSIQTYARHNGGDAFGSSVQYMAESLHAIAGDTITTGFASNGLRSSNAVFNYLTVANTSGVWGGNSGTSRILTDFYDSTATSTRLSGSLQPQSLPSGRVNLVNLANRQYQTSGDVRLTTSGVIPNGLRATIYVNGDALIENDIVYSGSYTYDLSSDTAYETIPYITVIARGNIYIQSDVNNLSGLFIAQPLPDGSKGEIYTCANGKTVPTNKFAACSGRNADANALLSAVCNGGNNATTRTLTGTPLTVYGSFIARRVSFDRTNGSLRCARPGGRANAFVSNPETANSPVVAEKFIYTPEMTLGRPLFKPRTSQSSNDFGDAQSYTTLPPVF